MVNARAIGRVGVLVAGLGIGMAFASIPGTASADSSDWLSSVDSVLSGLSAPADTASSPEDIQISIDGTDLFSTADNEATATSGQGDIAIAIGDGASATANGGTGDYAFADGTDTIAKITGGDYNIAELYAPSGTVGSVADAGTKGTAAGDYDLVIIVGIDGATANAQGADYARPSSICWVANPAPRRQSAAFSANWWRCSRNHAGDFGLRPLRLTASRCRSRRPDRPGAAIGPGTSRGCARSR